MIGERPDGWKWAQSAGLSVAIHAAVLGYLIWQPSFDFLSMEQVEPLAAIEITAIMPEVAPELAATPAETITAPETGEEILQSDGGSETITSSSLPELTPSNPDPARLGTEEVLNSTIETGDPAPDKDPLPVESRPDAVPPDPRMLQLIERIRARLTEPCMLALPMMRGDGEMQLNVVSDSDRNITALMDDLTAGIDGEITRQAVLLDHSQCPAVTFVRRDQRYPVYALGIQLESQQIARGTALRGQINNAAGYYQSLLMIDENGIVHDLRRFLLNSTRVTRFDFSVARYMPSRDTHQMLVALATPNRPETLSSHAGATADEFFEALFAEVGQDALIGVSSFYVQ
ncbi:MAG: hypothetical protein DI616_01885 [Paracoccus denitrificans]|uniref:Uncharacterized protein n=1 Tax=Paracoccus denitrificans TaxID=266 RepID=A0A533IBE4_PARDE|nr:MAG: hypothetical protein DI616_01885 [Paracoccus denitrificans]